MKTIMVKPLSKAQRKAMMNQMKVRMKKPDEISGGSLLIVYPHNYNLISKSFDKNKGVQLILDAVVDFLPSPKDVGQVKGTKPNSEEELVRKCNDAEPFSALAFKIANDPFVGSLTFIRI